MRAAGRLVVLIGEAGTGKSRLVSELTAAADQAATGASSSGGATRPSASCRSRRGWTRSVPAASAKSGHDLVDALEPALARRARATPARAVEPASAPPVGARRAELAGRSGGDPRYPFEAISELLKQLSPIGRSLVVVLEDAHWADDMSVRLLAFLGRRLHQDPAAGGGDDPRGGARATSGCSEQSLDELDEQGALRRLPGGGALARRHRRAGAGARARRACPASSSRNLAQDAWRVSDGNPFVVIEVMHALREGQTLSLAQRLPLPARVRKLVQYRLERLSSRERRLIAVAAVIGRQFDFALVQRAADMSERESSRGRWKSSSAIACSAVPEMAGSSATTTSGRSRPVTFPHRSGMALHRRVAGGAWEDGVTGKDLATHALALGTHYRNGEAWEKSAAFLHLAGRQAALRSAHAQAVACFEEALDALRRLPASAEVDDRDLDIRIELRQSLYPMGRFADLIRHLREGKRIAEKLDAGPRLARVVRPRRQPRLDHRRPDTGARLGPARARAGRGRWETAGWRWRRTSGWAGWTAVSACTGKRWPSSSAAGRRRSPEGRRGAMARRAGRRSSASPSSASTASPRR